MNLLDPPVVATVPATGANAKIAKIKNNILKAPTGTKKVVFGPKLFYCIRGFDKLTSNSTIYFYPGVVFTAIPLILLESLPLSSPPSTLSTLSLLPIWMIFLNPHASLPSALGVVTVHVC